MFSCFWLLRVLFLHSSYRIYDVLCCYSFSTFSRLCVFDDYYTNMFLTKHVQFVVVEIHFTCLRKYHEKKIPPKILDDVRTRFHNATQHNKNKTLYSKGILNELFLTE